MKLLSIKEARSTKKRENDTLVDSNLRLRSYLKTTTDKLNTVKENYDQDKIQKLKEFERFCQELGDKRALLLEELAQWQKLLSDTKEIYYGYISKKDELQEQQYKIEEEHKKLNLRETFISDLEQKWQAKQ